MAGGDRLAADSDEGIALAGCQDCDERQRATFYHDYLGRPRIAAYLRGVIAISMLYNSVLASAGYVALSTRDDAAHQVPDLCRRACGVGVVRWCAFGAGRRDFDA
jgi:hypothetical protein